MRFTADRAPLLEAVARVQSAAGNGKSIPILGTLLLRTEGDRVSVRATDSKVEATARASATVDRDGSVCVPVDQLADLLRNLPDGAEIGFSADAGEPRLSVVCARSRFKLPTLPADGFPAMREESGEAASGMIKASDLARLLDKTLFAVSLDDTRYYLQGVHLHVANGPSGEPLLRAVSTDGMKLAVAEAACPEGLEGLSPVTLPTRLATELRRWLGSRSVDIEICASPRHLRFDLGESRLHGPANAGDFPDYRRVIPRDPQRVALVDLGLLRHAVRRVVIAASPSEKSKIKAVALDMTGGCMSLASRSVDRGEAHEDVAIDYDGPDVRLPMNSAYLLEICERLGGNKLQLRFDGPGDPILLCDPEDALLRYVLMPLRA